MSNILVTIGKFLASLGKGYAKNTAKKREKDDTKTADNEQKTMKNNG